MADGATELDAVNQATPVVLYITEKPVIGVPPSFGTVHDTVAERLAGTAVTCVVRSGATSGDTAAVISDHGPRAPLLTPATRNT